MATTYTTSINDLEELKFIGGNEYTLAFDIYNSTGSPIDLTPVSTSWAMSYLGQPGSPVLVKSGTFSGSPLHRFTVEISGSNTLNLSGVFIHQPIITDFDGAPYRPSQGRIIIIPAIQTA
jgi:hypothetical protein